jgi:hypothetical protein
MCRNVFNNVMMVLFLCFLSPMTAFLCRFGYISFLPSSAAAAALDDALSLSLVLISCEVFSVLLSSSLFDLLLRATSVRF